MMKKGILSFLVVLFHIYVGFTQQIFHKQTTLMGSVFEFSVVADDSVQAKKYFNLVIKEMERIENLISEWRPNTQVSLVNQHAGIRPISVDRELFELTQRAIDYSWHTDGAFDISIAAMDKIWVFDGSMEKLPTQDAIRKAIKHVGYQHVLLDSINSTIFLQKKGMKIGFGSIGKGYAADKGRELLQSLGAVGGIVNASGDLATWGKQPNGEPWKIGVRNSFKAHKIDKILQLTYGAVATSGNDQKFVEIDGVRYAHIIDPRTGWPSSGLRSVTVSGESAEFANFLSTSAMALGYKRAKILLRKFGRYKAIMVKDR